MGFSTLLCRSAGVIRVPNVSILFFFCFLFFPPTLRVESCSRDSVRRRLPARFVSQVRGEGVRGQMAALTIQRTDNFLHTFLQVCCTDVFCDAPHADFSFLLPALKVVKVRVSASYE